MTSSVFPYEVSCGLLVFIYCQKLKDDDGWNSECISKESQRKILIGMLKIIKSSDCSWDTFNAILKDTCTEELYNTFLKEANSMDTLDEFLDIFKSLEELVIDPVSSSMNLSTGYVPVQRSSVLGLFIRKLILKFKKLSFEETFVLHADFLKYKGDLVINQAESKLDIDNVNNDTSQSMDLSCIDEGETSKLEDDHNKENISSSSINVDQSADKPSNNNDDDSKSHNQKSLRSRKNVCQFIEKHVSMLESNRHEVLEPNKLQEKLNVILKLHANIPDVYYLSFLNYLRLSEMNKASKMLCLYFDHKNFQTPGTDISEQEKHQDMFKRFRYGALNLGIMHCKHRNYGQSMIVLKEAVRIAQETNDDMCLKHAIFWIDVVKEETNQLDNGEIEARTSELIKEIYTEDENVIDNVDDTESFGMLRCTRLLALRGLQHPRTILSNISRIVVSNSKVSDTALLARSSVMDLYSLKVTSLFNCQYPLQTFHEGNGDLSRQIAEDNVSVALCHLASHFAKNLQHAEALSVLKFLQDRHKCYSHHLALVHQCRLRINFYRNIYQRDIKEAKHIAEFYSVYDKNESTYMKSLVDAVCGNYTKSYKSASQLLQELSTQADTTQLLISTQLLLVELKLCSGDPTSCIHDILELCTLVKQLHMNSFYIDVQLALVRYNLFFGLHEKSLKLIDIIFVTAFSMGNPYQQGNLYYFQAKCSFLALVDDEFMEDQNECFENILHLYDKAFGFFERADAKARLRDVFYEKAFVYHKMGLSQERNSTATQYRLLNEQLKDVSYDFILF